jgi:hypothetical protein
VITPAVTDHITDEYTGSPGMYDTDIVEAQQRSRYLGSSSIITLAFVVKLG